MSDAKNNGTIIGGLTADPELANDGKIAKLRLAVDYSGRDAVNPDNKTGYFDVIMFKGDDPNSKFVFGQINDQKMKKGSQVAVNYRLSHGRWQGEDGPRQKVELIAEGISYVGGGGQRTDDGTSEGSLTASAGASEAAAVPSKF